MSRESRMDPTEKLPSHFHRQLDTLKMDPERVRRAIRDAEAHPMRRGRRPLGWVMGLAAAVVVAIGTPALLKHIEISPSPTSPRSVTQERRIPPQPTSLGRVGPLTRVWFPGHGRQGYGLGTSKTRFKVFATTNGGERWATVYQGTRSSIFTPTMAFEGSERMWLLYADAQNNWHAISSRDGGHRWLSMALPALASGQSIQGLSAPSATTLYLTVVGQPGAGQLPRWIYESVNGGKTWHQLVSVPQTGFASKLEFLTPSQGFLVMSGSAGGSNVAGTIDGGASWQTPLGNLWSKAASIPSFEISGKGYGWADVIESGGPPGSYQQVLYTTYDRGVSWKEVATFPTTLSPFPSDPVDFVSTLDGWLWNQGHLYQTSDGGVHWIPVATPSTEPPRNMIFVSSRVGYFLDQSGALWLTVNGGRGWTPER